VLARPHRAAGRPILIYDDQCAFCRRWVRRLKRWDRADAIVLLPLADPEAPLVARRDTAALRRAAHLVRPDGTVFAGAAAARELFGFLPLGWILRAAMRIPGVLPVAEMVYAWIARTWGPVRP